MADYNSLKKCGFCGESIPSGAGRCPYCGSILEVKIDDSYQIDPNEHLNNNISEQDADGQMNTDGQPSADAPQDQTNHLQEPQSQQPQPQRPDLQPGGSDLQQPRMQPYRPVQGDGRSPYQNSHQNPPTNVNPTLSNGLKVLLTIIFTIIPGIGQIAGIITAIIFMGSTDQDRKSFGVAILVASLIMFVLSCLGCFIFSIAASNIPSIY